MALALIIGLALPLLTSAAFATTASLQVAPTGAPLTAQVSAQAQLPGASSGQVRSRPPSPKGATPAAAVKDEAKPTWAELTAEQQQSLGPLAASWKTLTEAHKRKWIALSANYPKMSPPEQARLRSRMTEWAALSPQQRTQARLNFAESEKLPATDKRAAWEAYQQLPPEEKKKLAAGATATKPPPPPTAPAVRPVEPQKQARVPPRRADAQASGKIDQHTLLPQPAASSPQSN